MMADMLAILYDIHGNLPALEAVLADAEAAGATAYQLGGDYSAFGTWPVECVERLQALEHARWIRGNWERWQTDPSAAPESEIVQGAAAHVIAALGPERVAELGRLPAEDSYDHTLFCHASPGSDMEPISRDADPDSDDQALAGVTQPRVVFGHTHVQFRRVSAAGIELVNPGSVGLPWDGDQRAAYALIDDERVELRRVAYDVEAAAAPLDAIGAPWATATAARLRAAVFDV
jgi:predicted phosphodiesterase